jgi:toxin ParE1/3/4
MTVRIVVQPEAGTDLEEAFRWYEARRPGLGRDFLDETDCTLKRIAEHPLRPRTHFRKTRRAKLNRFPYVTLYVVRDDVAYILAVLHERRNPRLLRARARGFHENT